MNLLLWVVEAAKKKNKTKVDIPYEDDSEEPRVLLENSCAAL